MGDVLFAFQGGAILAGAGEGSDMGQGLGFEQGQAIGGDGQEVGGRHCISP